ncbi:MAG: cellulose binding domain-containing protein, partial [Myxococcota bacterium]
WNGFTAELTVYNETEAELDSWSFRFRSSHSISGAPWGIEITTTDLDNGLFKHRVTGTGWASSIPAGGSVRVGFNAHQGTPIGNEGPLTAEQVFDGGLLAD